jgi:2-dehydropantoate 2-reductase
MRILALGAGAIGGYYGAHLIAAGGDVTFLVRPRRAAQLAAEGLVLHSGGQEIRRQVKTVQAGDLTEAFDLILLACKSYDLDSAMDAVAPVVGPGTVILPILNGIAHFDALDARFGADRVLGGVCMISITLDAQGHIRHFGTMDTMLFADRHGRAVPQLATLAEFFAKTPVTARISADIVQDLWDKWAMLAAGGALTCLLRGNVSEIMATRDGRMIAEAIAEECRALCQAAGHTPRPEASRRTLGMLTDAKSPFITSMRRDLDNGVPKLEAGHILGDLLTRGGLPSPLVSAAYCQLQIHAARHAG